jgi:DNA-binding NtrC family response regulator
MTQGEEMERLDAGQGKENRMDASGKILIIDDEEHIRQILAEMLMQCGWSVASAGTPDEALQLVKAERYVLAIVDNLLGSLEGIELIERIQGTDPELPCVLMGGNLSVDITSEALKKGAAGFLRKPFRVEELLVSIEQAQRMRSLLQQQKDLSVRLAREHP